MAALLQNPIGAVHANPGALTSACTPRPQHIGSCFFPALPIRSRRSLAPSCSKPPQALLNNTAFLHAGLPLLTSSKGVCLGLPSLCQPKLTAPTRNARYRLVAAYEAENPTPASEQKRPTVVNLPKAIWMQLTQPLRNFGYGRRSMWEGGVGLFIMVGAGLLMLVFAWIKGQQVRSRSHKYTAVVEFQQACGITVGTPVRIRGVDVGQAVKVKPSLAAIDVVVELQDQAVVIPRNALVEVNQSGLISETLIDITPRHPIPAPKYGPLDAGCEEEGLIVCDRHKIKGEQGVSLDELVGICTKIAKQMDAQGIDKVFETATAVRQALADSRPLLQQVNVTPRSCFFCYPASVLSRSRNWAGMIVEICVEAGYLFSSFSLPRLLHSNSKVLGCTQFTREVKGSAITASRDWTVLLQYSRALILKFAY